MSAETEWCGQCYAPRGRASSAHSVITAPTRHVPAVATLPPEMIRTRWRKTTTTFGPAGRIMATFGLVVPMLLLVVLGVLSGGLTIFGAGIWGFVIMPWGLRDVWRAGQLPAK